jgi:hypothetical protein
MDKTQGINSLNRRLCDLEKAQSTSHHRNRLSPPSSDDDELTKMVSGFQQKEKDKKKKTMRQILDHYNLDLLKETVNITFDNLFHIVFFTIKYVEANYRQLSLTLSVQISSEFKQSLAISLIKHVLPNLSSEMLELSIDTAVALLCPKQSINLSELSIEEEKPKKKKGLFSK